MTPPRPSDPLLCGQSRVRCALGDFAKAETSGAIVLLAAAILALVLANSPLAASYQAVWRTQLGVSLGSWTFAQSLRSWIDDGLMALFFFVIGLEIKREVLVGELSSARKAALPGIAALGGMAVPAVLYLALNAGAPGARGWAVPTATDIAFALGACALLARRLAPGVRVVLTALAIADDIGAMLIIAFFYGAGVRWGLVAVAAALVLLLFVLNRLRVDAAWPYAVTGVLVWFAVLSSGLHATIAGVLVAFAIPARSILEPDAFTSWARGKLDAIDRRHVPDAHVLADDEPQLLALELRTGARNTQAPLQRLEWALQPIADFVVLPLFALANAGIPLAGGVAALGRPVTLGVMLGLVLGKQLGVTAAAWGAVKLRVASLPEGMRWRDLYGVGWLAGIGFTMSLFITNLAFGSSQPAVEARTGILAGSLISAIGAIAYFALVAGVSAERPQ